MDGAIAIILISIAMFVGCFLLGLIPLLFKMSEQKLQFVSVLGAGMLCGTALAIIIPEGVELLESSWRVPPPPCPREVNSSAAPPTLPPQQGPPPHFFMGLSLVLGFTLMFLVDQIGSYLSIHDPRTGMSSSSSITATLGLVIHAAGTSRSPALLSFIWSLYPPPSDTAGRHQASSAVLDSCILLL
ncbi:hypothetical protein GJAV_G00243820 [Gymnothorax javanicus]|nr:hypothetical protein GJAV_G00243820 [Gymnothorax javanicus]